MPDSFVKSADYAAWLGEVKLRIRLARGGGSCWPRFLKLRGLKCFP